MKRLTTIVTVALYSGAVASLFADNKQPTSQKATEQVTSDVLELAVTAAKTPLDRAHANLNLVRFRLVNECAAPLSAELCWSAKPEPALRDIVAKSRLALDAAKVAIKDLPQSMNEKLRHELSDRFDMLSAFADLFGAMADVDDKTEASSDRLIKACIAVSTYLDDPNPGVAESAKLWQGVAYRRAGRPDRTLQLLWPAIGELSSNRVDFFVRIERCRSLADKGQFVAALSLAMKLGEHVDECMKNEDDDSRKLAEQSLRWVRAIIYRRWADTLREQGRNERAKAAEEAAAKLIGDATFPPGRNHWLRLEQTIVGLPEWRISDTEPTEESVKKS